ncbi:HD domain-containing protein [bacterium]|nr:HD domain-containing protein [bacterium]
MIEPFADRRWAEALAMAFRWHSGQTRKSTGLPYVIHCVEVAANLERLGFDEPVVIAGLLHDILEDTAIPPDTISERFGREVLEIVQALTEKKRTESGQKRPWIDRKRDHIRHLRHSGRNVRGVALADQRQNLESVLDDGKLGEPGFWAAFNASPGDYLEYHRRRLAACRGDEPGIRELTAAVAVSIERIAENLARTGLKVAAEFGDSDWT